jgi:sugar phosphate isomerase/epimerase
MGYKWMEVIYDAPHFRPGLDKDTLKGIKELLSSNEMGVSVHASFWDLNPASHYPEIQKLTLKQLEYSIKACRALDGEIVVFHFGGCPVFENRQFFTRAKERYRKLVRSGVALAEEHGVKLTLENAGGRPSDYPQNVKELLQFIQEFDGLGVTLDIGHAHLSEKRAGNKTSSQSIADGIRVLGDNLVHLHIHDNSGESDDHLPPGKGKIEFEPILKALDEIDYRGVGILEIFCPEDPINSGRAGLLALSKLLKKQQAFISET